MKQKSKAADGYHMMIPVKSQIKAFKLSVSSTLPVRVHVVTSCDEERRGSIVVFPQYNRERATTLTIHFLLLVS